MDTNNLISQIPDYLGKSLEATISRPALCLVSSWIETHEIEIICTKERSSKTGDYRPSHNGKKHRITINRTLNPYSFLITLIHEFAHFKAWEKYKNSVNPHGNEWKTEYKNLICILNPFLTFPQDINNAFLAYMENPKASISNCYELVRALKRYDAPSKNTATIESLYHNQVFKTKSGREFQNLGKIRRRHRCIELNSGKVYLFNPLAEVLIV